MHYVDLDEAEAVFASHSVPAMRAVIERAESSFTDRYPPMAVEGRNFAMHQLTKDSLSCYWLKAIERYAAIYFS